MREYVSGLGLGFAACALFASVLMAWEDGGTAWIALGGLVILLVGIVLQGRRIRRSEGKGTSGPPGRGAS
ncbi:hypothetical protein [Brachybacterium squillarum]|uniref:hypothetical protein n=1 Tax=Brachybacterium squillarum TaxID=661979 RepID=UPI0022226202|nr:hypothetical protein [Brachybacterium squillarum]MCW1805870.1 hypothetical protein [Brachybacterium squillarum]